MERGGLIRMGWMVGGIVMEEARHEQKKRGKEDGSEGLRERGKGD